MLAKVASTRFESAWRFWRAFPKLGCLAEDGSDMFYRLGHFAAHKSWLICAAWLLIGVVLTIVAPAWDTQTQDDDVRFVPNRFTSVRAYHLLEQAFPQEVFASLVIFE